jgi:hypothetical protein
MRFEVADIIELRPVIAEVVRATLAQIDQDRHKMDGRLGFGESEAAELLGLPRHSLRDLRLSGQVKGSRLGKRIIYQRAELEKLLEVRCE